MEIIVTDSFWKSFHRMTTWRYKIKDWWYGIRCYFWHRYTTCKPRYLPHTWMDRGEVLPHMMFEILSKFVEEECSPGIVGWYGEVGHKITIDGQEKFVRDEMQDLYDWWHKEWNKEYEKKEEKMWEEIGKYSPPLEKMFKDNRYDPQYDSSEQKENYKRLIKELNEYETQIQVTLQDNMHRLVNLQPYLWT